MDYSISYLRNGPLAWHETGLNKLDFNNCTELSLAVAHGCGGGALQELGNISEWAGSNSDTGSSNSMEAAVVETAGMLEGVAVDEKVGRPWATVVQEATLVRGGSNSSGAGSSNIREAAVLEAAAALEGIAVKRTQCQSCSAKDGSTTMIQGVATARKQQW